ncbi:MAG: helix-turn-helix domain-containing protein [Actinomycetota bacterium]|nr:helix-turn-helix domain-containing protein [Actinomycetota bacterium]
MAQPHDSYMTTGEVAETLGISPKTVARWADDDRLPHLTTLGGHRRFPRAEIERLAQSRKLTQSSE